MKYILKLDQTAEESVTVVARAPSDLTEQIENLVLAYKGEDKISVWSEDEMIQLSFSDIECIAVVDRKVVAIDKNNVRYRIQKRLFELEEMLPSYFIRINKSALANEKRILRFKTVWNGGVDVVFKCGYRDYVSRRCFSEIKRRFQIK
ncbi:MAG: LytTR family transcriptional regulator [Clostridia bacterium]|nr:LytTR family transcriptional regulator [Clostridia bacterium]